MATGPPTARHGCVRSLAVAAVAVLLCSISLGSNGPPPAGRCIAGRQLPRGAVSTRLALAVAPVGHAAAPSRCGLRTGGFTAMLIGDGRVRVKSSVRAGALLAGVTPFVVRRLGSVRACVWVG